MTSFKDLLSKDDIATIKDMAGKKDSKSNIDTNGKPTDVHLPNARQIHAQAQRLGSAYVDDDKVLFMQAMNGVRPLKNELPIGHQLSQQSSKKDDPNALFRRAAATGGDDTTTTHLSDMQALLNPVASEAFLSYKNPTLPTKTFEQLKQGKLRWYEAVDLHNTSIDDARQAILQLIKIANDANETVVKIVHGKGTDAIIKTCVNGWLRQIPQVLAFVSAPTKDGGTGAVLVLLKKQSIRSTK